MQIQKNEQDILKELRQFTGTENYYKSTFGRLLLTDGINFLRNEINCYWLIDIVESVQYLKKIQENKPFILWTIEVKENKTAIVTARSDTNAPILYKQEIKYTDFPLNKFEFYQCDNVLLLKEEY